MFSEDEVDLPYVIAELGPNWCVSRDPEENHAALYDLIDIAKVCRASAVKLQLKSQEPGGYYTRENLDRPIDDPRSPFRTRRQYVEAREPTRRVLAAVAHYCAPRGLDWSVSCWDLPSVALLESCGHRPAWVKVASASITDTPLLEATRALGIPVVLSTGMSTLDEVDRAASTLGETLACVLHCVSTYPCVVTEIDLRVMATLRARYGVPVGWSGHERGIEASVAAAALGAAVIERHITQSRDAWGPDHSASLELADFAQLVKGCRIAHGVALAGSGEKVVVPSEVPHRERLRRVAT